MGRTGFFLLLAFALAACGGGDESETTPETPEIVRSVTYGTVNGARTGCGFPALGIDSRLEAAAEAHANYLRLNKATGHKQTLGQPGFVGVRSEDRARHFGARYEWVGEVISYDQGAEESVRELLAAPYHGQSLLWDHYEYMGVSATSPFVPSTSGRALFLSHRPIPNPYPDHF